MILYHRSPAAAAILGGGFADRSGSYGLVETTLTGVFVSDVPLDVNDGVTGALMSIELDAAGLDLDEWEIVEELKGYREWCIPAAVLNRHGSLSLVDEDVTNRDQITGFGPE